MKPPIPYYGGKTSQAERIVDLLPPHQHYVEPFAGSLAVLLAKPRSPMETVNDLDRHLVTFWRVLRDHPEDLERVMRLTPHSRSEYADADVEAAVTDLEIARRVWVQLSQGRGATLRNTGWRFRRDAGKPGAFAMPGYLAAYADRVGPVAARLAGVTLECGDALEVINAYGQYPDVLLYCDPPYLGATRAANYAHELVSAQDHRELAEALHACRAAVVLSGYASPLYDELFTGWHRTEYAAWTGNGIRGKGDKASGDRVEVLWSNRTLGTPDLFAASGMAL